MVIFVIFAIHKCDLPPINTPQGIMVFKNFLPFILINSCQFDIIRIFWVWSTVLWKWWYRKCGVYPQNCLKWVILSDQCEIMANVVSNKSSQPWEFIDVYFGNLQWLPWQRQSWISQKQRKISISIILRRDFPQVHTHVDQYGY